MSDLKSILILILLFPAISVGQTIHVNKEKQTILYSGQLEWPGLSKQAIYNKAKSILLNYVNSNTDSLQEKKDKKELATTASIRLTSPYHLIKQLTYRVKLQPTEESIKYEIDDIRLTIRERGKKAKVYSAQELLKGMEESGPMGMRTEKQLNEIDMHLQKLVAIMQEEQKPLAFSH